MIVFYVLILSASIIFGSCAKNKVLGQLYGRCPGCGREGYQTGVRSQRWFTLYFLPVIPMSKSTTLRCNLCGYQWQVDNKQADAWFLAPQNQPQVPQIR